MKRIMFFLILCNFTVAFAAENPLISGKGEQKPAKSIGYPLIVQYVINKITPVQYSLRNRLTQLTNDIKNTKSKKTLLILIGIALIYGIIHAVGPGHGKTISFSYFLSNNGDVKKGIMLGNLIAFLQVGSAILIVVILYFIIKQSYLVAFEDFRRVIKLISYSLIALIGIFLTFRAFGNLRKRKFLKTDADFQGNDGNIIPIAISIGMVPCPAAVIVLLFSLSMDILKVGIILTLFMAMGMGITISLVGVLTITIRKNISKVFLGKGAKKAIFQTIAEFTGALLVFVLGVILFIVNLL